MNFYKLVQQYQILLKKTTTRSGSEHVLVHSSQPNKKNGIRTKNKQTVKSFVMIWQQNNWFVFVVYHYPKTHFTSHANNVFGSLTDFLAISPHIHSVSSWLLSYFKLSSYNSQQCMFKPQRINWFCAKTYATWNSCKMKTCLVASKLKFT